MRSLQSFRRLGALSQRQRMGCVRHFASQPSLDVEFPGIPELSPASAHEKPETRVTTLPNGLRVASEETYGQVTTMGIFVNAGSRYENDENSGVSHMLEHMAFKSTTNRSHLRLVRDVEDIGGSVGAASAREYMMYTAECLRNDVAVAMDIMADTLLRPAMAPWDIEEERRVIGYELEDMEMNAQALLTELLHAAAYGDGSPLGRPLWCPKRNLAKLGEQQMREFMARHFTAPRMVLSAAGIEHDHLVDLANEYLSDLPTKGPEEPVMKPSPYIGGDRRTSATSPLTHVALAFSVDGWLSDDLLDICALHLMLGGGGSFSAGGPGKGMYSRLYTNVLNRHHWVDSATAFNSMYNDGGLLGIYGTCAPSDAGRLVDLIAAELLDLANNPPNDEETQRAKNQLKSSILMKLESRQELFEDIGRQILTYGKRESPTELCARVEKITSAGIQKAAQKALKSAVTVVAFGNVSSIPSYDVISQRFSN